MGSSLVPRLLAEGWQVRVLARNPHALTTKPWSGQVEIVTGGVDDPDALRTALDGVAVAYYLVHSMAATYEYASRDRILAEAFSEAAGAAGVSRIVYLGGLHPQGVELSAHLDSRREVGRILLDGPVPTTVLQGGIVIGAGSASFDLLRQSVRLPIIVGPTWLSHRIQPIAFADALHYLVGAANVPPEVNRAYDIGGPESLTYKDLIRTFVAAVGHRAPRIVMLPVLLPRTASLWAGIAAPGSSTLNAALVHSLILDMVCLEHDIDEVIDPPAGGTQDVITAIRSALDDSAASGRVSRTS